MVDGQTIADYVEIDVKTDEYKRPNEIFKVDTVSDTSIVFKKTTNNYADRISNIVLYVGRDTYNMGSSDIYTCEGLYKDAEYKVYCTYDIYDPDSGNKYKGQTEEIVVKTLPFKAPSIVKFEESRKSSSSVTFAYEYLDEDIVGLNVYVDDRLLGRVNRIEKHSVNEILVIKNDEKNYLVPYNFDIIENIDLEKRKRALPRYIIKIKLIMDKIRKIFI